MILILKVCLINLSQISFFTCAYFLVFSEGIERKLKENLCETFGPTIFNSFEEYWQILSNWQILKGIKFVIRCMFNVNVAMVRVKIICSL